MISVPEAWPSYCRAIGWSGDKTNSPGELRELKTMQRQPGKQGSHQTRCDLQEILFNFLKCLTNTRNFPLDCIDTNVYKLYLLDIYKCVWFVFQIYIRIWYISWLSNKMKGNDTEYMWTYCWKKEKKKYPLSLHQAVFYFDTKVFLH